MRDMSRFISRHPTATATRRAALTQAILPRCACLRHPLRHLLNDFASPGRTISRAAFILMHWRKHAVLFGGYIIILVAAMCLNPSLWMSWEEPDAELRAELRGLGEARTRLGRGVS